MWRQVLAVRDVVSKGIEEVRSSGRAGSSLATEVSLWADGELHETLDRIGDELRFLLITSQAIVGSLEDAPAGLGHTALEGGSIAVQVSASAHGKCVRCWHQREDVGNSEDHPELCGRCIINVEGPGEVRRIG